MNDKEKFTSSKFVSVTAQFKEQLTSLLTRIRNSSPHYIRCIKSNAFCQPDLISRISVCEQLRYGGVIEAVRVSRSGFPVRMTHKDFIDRYDMLKNPFITMKPGSHSNFCLNGNRSVSREFCAEVINLITDDWFPPSDKTNETLNTRLKNVKQWKGTVLFSDVSIKEIQLGKTKVFLRRDAYDILEGRRTRFLSTYCTKIQTVYRRHYAKLKVAKLRSNRVDSVNRAASIIQAATRSFKERRNFLSFKRRIIKMQSALRGRRTRCEVAKMLDVELEEMVLEMELRNEYALRLQYAMKRLILIHRLNLFRAVVILLVDTLREKKRVPRFSQ